MGAARSIKLAKEKLGDPGYFNPALQLLEQGVDVPRLGVHAVEASAGLFDAVALALGGQVATGAKYLLEYLFNLAHLGVGPLLVPHHRVSPLPELRGRVNSAPLVSFCRWPTSF